MTDTTSHWQPIETAPRDRPVRLRGVATYKDDTLIVRGTGQYDNTVHLWTGILGGNPTEWMDLDDV